MTLMPAAVACCSTAIPDVGSMESMISTLTPSPIMLCAICWKLAVLPCAFWMSDAIPAASNAAFSSGASYNVYRVDEVESGRITPTIPVALATGLGGVVGGGLAVDAGGLVSLQTALTVCGELLDDADELLPGLQAASVRTATAPIAAIGKV